MDKELDVLGNLDTALLHGNDKPQAHRVYGLRYWMLFVLSMVCLLQGFVWNTWSPISQVVEELYDWQDGDLALLTNWGPISFIIAVFPNSWLMGRHGVRPAVLIASTLVFVGSALRCLPLRPGLGTKVLVNIAQMLNGLAGPVAMSAAPVLSAAWFPPAERTGATAVAEAVNAFGVALSFIVGPLMVPCAECGSDSSSSSVASSALTPSNRSLANKQLQDYMGGTAAVAGLTMLAVFLYFPSNPPTPPAHSASQPRLDFVAGMKELWRNRDFWLVALAYGIFTGVFGGWSGMIAPNLAHHLSQSDADNISGWLGFWATVAGVIWMVAIGKVADTAHKEEEWKWLTHRLLLLVQCAVAALAFLWFAIIVGMSGLSHRLPSFYASAVIASAMSYGVVPLFYESAAEVAYPVAEGLTVGVLTGLNNLAAIFFLILPEIPGLGVSWMNWAVMLSAVAGICLLLPYKETNSRSAHDQHNSIDGSENESDDDHGYLPPVCDD